MSTRKVDIDLQIEGASGAFRVKSIRLKEGISKVTHARVRIASAEDLEFDRSLAKPAILSLLLDGAEARRFSLRLGRATLSGIEGGSTQYELDLYAPMWLLGLCVNTRKFRDKSIEAVVSQILTERGIPFAWQLVRKTEPRSYVTQYRETDLSFVCRLLEHEGIYYTTDPGGVLVLGDSSPTSPEVEGDSHFELLEAAGAMDRDKSGIHAFRRGARVAPGTVTLAEFDWKRPKLELRPSSYSDRDTELEIYDYPGGFRDPEEGQRLVRMRLEAQRAGAAFAEGSGNVPAFAPAHRFSFGGGALGRFSGDYLIVRVEHRFEDRAATRAGEGEEDAGPGTTYENHFQVIPAEVVFRPPLVTPRPSVAGCHTAMVRGPSGSEIHTDRYGRFKAQFHWDREATGTDADSRWLRMLQEPATSMNLARTGWEVNVAYIDGDPDRPIGLSRNINGVMAPAYSMPANKNMMAIKTPSSPASGGYNEIKLDDSAGAMCFALRAEKDFMGVVKHDRSERVNQNEQHRVGQCFQHTVMQNQTLTIGGSSDTTIQGGQTLEIKGNRTVRVGGSESIKIEGSANISTAKNETEKVSSVRFTVAGSLKMPDIKAMAASVVPNPKAALMGAAQSAVRGGVQSLLKGDSPAGGAASALSASLQNMIPTPSGIASQLTGGLSQGVTPEKLIDLFCTGSITRTGEKKITRKVGGAFISAGVGTTSTTVGYVHAETIGGAKITVAKGNVSETVMGPLALTVGGTVLRTSKNEMRIASKSSSIKVGAACSLESDERVELHGKAVSVEAKANLSLLSGGLAIEMSPGKISMKGKLLIEAGAQIIFQGKPDKLTQG